MANLLRAEWKKITTNRVLVGFLVWIIPVGMAAFYSIMLVLGLLSNTFTLVGLGAGGWTDDMRGVWGMIISSPSNTLGRVLPLAFMAVVFASEYQSDTWKNIIPRSRRPALLLVKLVTLTAVVMTSFFMTSMIAGAGQWLGHRAAGIPYPPEPTVQVVGEFLRDYTLDVLFAFVTLVILASSAALAAIVTRSILGSLLAAFLFSVAEPLSLGILYMLGTLLKQPNLVNLYLFTPSYSLDNLRSWLMNDTFRTVGLVNWTAEPQLLFSCIVLAGWILGLLGLALHLFQRQDIT